MTVISIIMPVYNTERYLQKCLESVINQTFKDIELLCVNDGSTDRSKSILEEYAAKDSRIKILEQKHSGPATTRNLGLKNASGEYLMFLDSDDYYEPDMCKEMLECLISQNVDVVICDCNMIECQNHARSEGDMLYHRMNLPGKSIVGCNNINGVNRILWNKIFKKKICDDYSISFPDGYEHDDASFVFQYLVAADNIFGLEKKLYNYVLRESSIMYNVKQKINFNSKNDAWHSIKHTLDFLRKHNKFKEYLTPFHKLFIEETLWTWSYLDKSEKLTAASIIMNIFTDSDLELLKQCTSHPDFYQTIRNKNKEQLIDIISSNTTFAEKIFSIKHSLTNHTIVRLIGFKLSINNQKVKKWLT